MGTRNAELGTRNAAAGFTLIELIVVVAIIVILIGMVTVVATRTVEGARERQTLVTLELLDSALQEFASSNPLRGWAYSSGPYGAGPPTLTAAGLHDQYRRAFGPYPPHYDWYDTRIAGPGSPNHDDVREWTLADSPTPTISPPVINDSRVKLFANPGYFPAPTILPKFFSGAPPAYSPDPSLGRHDEEYSDNLALNPERYDIENSESLYYWLNQLCPEAKPILDKLPDGAVTNTDVYARVPDAPKVTPLPDYVDPFGNSPGTVADDQELFEIRDGWGNVISYWVYYIDETGSGFVNGRLDGGFNAEKFINPVPVLESAGRDGRFGHRPGIGINLANPHRLDDEQALGDNLFNQSPPWRGR